MAEDPPKDEAKNEPKNATKNARKDKGKNESREPYVAILMAIVFLAVALGVLVLTRHVAKIKGDAVLVALLLIPIFVYLAIMGKLKGFTLGPLSASFIERKVDDIKKTVEDKVNEVGEYEEERSTYLGKLSQISTKTSQFCLIYADVDGLRQHSRKIFLRDQRKPFDKRTPEHEIRRTIIDKLDFALADAFCAEGIKEAKDKDEDAKNPRKHAKYDIFDLIEPDVVMIARDATLEQAWQVATRAQEKFTDYSRKRNVKGYTATMAIVSSDEGKRPRELDKLALERLSYQKRLKKKGGVYPDILV